MSRSVYELRKLQRRLVVEHNRLDAIADAFRHLGLSMSAVQVSKYAGALYMLSLSVGSMADAMRDPRGSRGMKRAAAQIAGGV